LTHPPDYVINITISYKKNFDEESLFLAGPRESDGETSRWKSDPGAEAASASEFSGPKAKAE
jgi:hypothetical protein